MAGCWGLAAGDLVSGNLVSGELVSFWWCGGLVLFWFCGGGGHQAPGFAIFLISRFAAAVGIEAQILS